MNLVIDQGNTRYKVALFDKKELTNFAVFDKSQANQIAKWVKNYTTKKVNIIVSSVVNQVVNLENIPYHKTVFLNENTNLPIQNKYKTPNTLGKDRLANACAVWALAHSKNALVIDLGTCIKYDLVNEKGEYLGGNISPGLTMRYKALSHFTDQLPLLNFEELNQDFGNNTETSMRCGVQIGIINEIKGFIDRYSTLYKGLTIFMTGGDTKYFDKSFKNDIFAVENLTLIGLNEILLHNE